MGEDCTGRQRFIHRYMQRSGVNAYIIDGEKVTFPGTSRGMLALPCECGDEMCEGWAMVSPEYREDHLRTLAPVSRP